MLNNVKESELYDFTNRNGSSYIPVKIKYKGKMYNGIRMLGQEDPFDFIQLYGNATKYTDFDVKFVFDKDEYDSNRYDTYIYTYTCFDDLSADTFLIAIEEPTTVTKYSALYNDTPFDEIEIFPAPLEELRLVPETEVMDVNGIAYINTIPVRSNHNYLTMEFNWKDKLVTPKNNNHKPEFRIKRFYVDDLDIDVYEYIFKTLKDMNHSIDNLEIIRFMLNNNNESIYKYLDDGFYVNVFKCNYDRENIVIQKYDKPVEDPYIPLYNAVNTLFNTGSRINVVSKFGRTVSLSCQYTVDNIAEMLNNIDIQKIIRKDDPEVLPMFNHVGIKFREVEN